MNNSLRFRNFATISLRLRRRIPHSGCGCHAHWYARLCGAQVRRSVSRGLYQQATGLLPHLIPCEKRVSFVPHSYVERQVRNAAAAG